MSTQPEVNIHVIGWIQNPLLEAGGPTLHWIGPETLVDLTIEGRNVNALVDSGSQVNMITHALVQQLWVSCPAIGRPSGLSFEPHRVRQETYKLTWVCHPVRASTGDHGV